MRALLRSLGLIAALVALTGCGMSRCRQLCAAECLGVHAVGRDYCTCDTRAVVPGCEVSR